MKMRYRPLVTLVALGLGICLGMSMIVFLAWLGQPTMGSAAIAAGSAASPRSLIPNAPNLTTTPTPPCGSLPTWTPGAVGPRARYAIQGALANDGNPRFTPVPSFFVVGGLDAFNNPIADVARYNSAQNYWSTVSSLPVAAGRVAVGGSSNYIFAAGGYLGPNGPNSVTSTLRIYNAMFGTWSTGAPAPSRVEAAAGTVLSGKFYVIGGDNYTDTLSTNYMYDIGSNGWSTGAPLPVSRKNAYATAQWGLLYLFGGLDAAGQATDTLFAYNPLSNSWTTLASPNTGGLGNYGGISSYGAGYLIVVDGGTSDYLPGGTTHIYDIANNTWIDGPPLITARMSMAQGTLSDGRIIVYGGLTSPGNVTGLTELLRSPCGPPFGTATPTPTWTSTRTPTYTLTPTPLPTCGLIFRRVTGPNPGSDNYLYRVATISANDIWAVGYYVSGGQQTLMQHWNGTSWSTFSGPATNNGALSDVTALSSNDVWAVGSNGLVGSSSSTTLVEHWDGTQWSIVPSPNVGAGNNDLDGVAAVATNDIWAVGVAGSYPNFRTLIEHWDGTQWSIVSSPNVGSSDQLNGVAVVASNDVWAVGEHNNQTLAEHWDGTQWSIVSSPSPYALCGFTGVAAVRGVPNSVWAVGYNTMNSGIDLIEHWDGTQWNVIPNTPSGWLNGVTAISVNDVWAVGYTYFGGNFPHALHWDGSVWITVLIPAYSNSEVFYGVGGVSSNDVWAVGNDHFTYPGRQTLIDRYNDPCLTPTPTSTPTPTCPPLRIVVGQSQPANPAIIHSTRKATNSFAKSATASKAPNPTSSFQRPTSEAPISFALDDGARETSIGFGIDNTESAALWLNRFTPPSNSYPITLNGIQIMWPDQSGTGDNLPGKTARLVVYQDADGDGNPSNATLLGQMTIIISGTEAYENYPVNIVAPGPSGDIYIGFEDLWAEAGYTPRMFPASQDTTTSQARSWIAAMGSGAPPDVNNLSNNDQLGTVDSFGLPGNWMIRATGDTQAGGCPPTRTPTPTPVPALIGHVVWQGPPAQPDARQQLPITLTLKLGANETNYPVQTTDSNGYFAVSLFGLPSGTYNWRAKGPKYLANSGTVRLDVRTLEGWKVRTLGASNLPTFQRSNVPTVYVEMGLMRGGDANNDNAVGSADFNIVKATFGKSQGDPGYDARADFNNDNAVNLPDFNVLKTNFGQGGAPPISPGGR